MPTYDVILKFILDQNEKQKTNAGVDQLTGDITDVDKIVRAATKDFEALEKQIAKAIDPKEFDSLERKLKDVDGQVKAITRSYTIQARVARAEAAAMVDGFEKVRLAQLKSIGGRIGGAARSGLLASGALFGGVLAEANRFAKDAEDAGRATKATREWTQATVELAAARARVDNVLLKEALPLIQQAAKVATAASAFIEKNPEIVRAALETGKIVAGLSILGTLVSKGITLYADTKALLLGSQELEAARIQEQAAIKQLVAAELQAKIAGVAIPGGKGGEGGPTATGGLSAAATTVGLVVAGVIASKYAVDITNIVLQKTGIAQDIAEAQRKIQETSRRPYPGFIRPERFEGMAAGGGTAGVSAVANLGLQVSANRAAVATAWEEWKADDARIVQEAADRRIQIVKDAESRIAQASAQFASRVAGINTNAQKREESLRSNFLKDETQAEIDYQEQRAQIIRDGGEQIRDIEEAHQERVRKMTADHNERVEDLTASRDALGLSKEQRRFNQERAEENRNTRLEIAKRRADLAERLADLDRQNQAERAQRLAQFQQALADNEAERKEQLKEAAAAFAEERKQAQAQRAAQLRDLQEGLNAERLRRREVFIAQIRDLDAALLGERNLRNQHYAQMIADAERFLADYRTKLPTANALPPVHDFTGYAMPGIYRMAANGQPEYVLSGAATRAAEKIIGGGLTQDAVLSALARGAGNKGRSFTINDHSRIDGRISTAQARAFKQGILADIAKELG